jgi:predicted metalloprotease
LAPGFRQHSESHVKIAASTIGSDRFQQCSIGCVSPDSFTHGSFEQRATLFRQGIETSQPQAASLIAVETVSFR